MPNSLKSRLKKLEHQGLLSEKDLSRIYTDNDVIEELEKINTEFLAKCPNTNARAICMGIVNNRIKELKGENNNEI